MCESFPKRAILALLSLTAWPSTRVDNDSLVYRAIASKSLPCHGPDNIPNRNAREHHSAPGQRTYNDELEREEQKIEHAHASFSCWLIFLAGLSFSLTAASSARSSQVRVILIKLSFVQPLLGFSASAPTCLACARQYFGSANLGIMDTAPALAGVTRLNNH